jgi:predicted dehydrogenase
MNARSFTRRRFLAVGSASAVFSPNLLLRGQSAPPNDQITFGVIGTGGMGMGNMNSFLNEAGTRVLAVCDVDAGHRDAAKKRVDEKHGNQDCKAYTDYRQLLEQPGIDAIVLSTPDHWHARIAGDSARAGKDVYGEKPFTWGLAEGRAVINELAKNKRIWQTGSWQRSGNEFRRFRALIQNGVLGRITRIECGTPSGMGVQQHVPADKVTEHIGKPPAGLDWKLWCGPAGVVEYHPLLHPWNWRWHTTFGGGQLHDWVGHHVDIALWTLGRDDTGPVKVEGTGKRVDHPFFNTLAEYEYLCTFADGTLIEVRSNFGGTKITGENGWIHVDRGRLDASDPGLLKQENLPADFNPRPPGHHRNFLDCLRSREPTVAPAEGAHRASSIGQLAIVAIDTGRTLKWDPQAEKVLDDDEQAKHPRLGMRLKI